MRKIFGLLATLTVCVPLIAHADPVVTSFTANPQSIGNGYTTTLTWNAAGSTGSSLYFTCVTGVTIKKDGSSFPCNTRQQVNNSSGGSADFTVTNVSGATKGIPVTIYPKDLNGTDADTGAGNLTLSVGTASQPIGNFSVSTSSVSSGGAVTLTWTGTDIPYANILLDCADNIHFYSDTALTQSLPCGSTAYASDQSQSGSVTIYPVNSALSTVTVTAHVIPAVIAGSYDMIHARSEIFDVRGRGAPATASATSFNSSATSIVSGIPFTITWATQNAAGSNLQFPCYDSINVFSVVGSSSTKLLCGTPTFSPVLTTSGTTTLSITNANTYGATFPIVLLPQDSGGTYLQTAGRSINLWLYPAGVTSASPVSNTTGAQNGASPSTTSGGATGSAPKNTKHYNFTIPLKRGSKNADVTALQTFLALNTTIYPGGLVTGLFGPATERAIGRLQVKYKIANQGDAGYLTVGPKTRALLNSLTTP